MASSFFPLSTHPRTPTTTAAHVDPSSLATVGPPASRLVATLLAASTTMTSLSAENVVKALPLVGGLVALALLAIKLPGAVARGWRSYSKEENSVGREYDAWTREKILEHYWGEHIHLGYYTEEEQKGGYLKKNFIGAKYDFIDKMMGFAKLDGQTFKPAKVLDVGCGIGGTTRYIAKKLGSGSKVSGITLSSEQVKRANELAAEQGVGNADFQVMDALKMDFPVRSLYYMCVVWWVRVPRSRL